MEKTNQPAWVKRIHRLLGRAKAKDRGFEVFGSQTHKYILAQPASEAAILAFESDHGFRLPEEYRSFLMFVGNGGAGPYYGIYSLTELERELKDDQYYCPQSEPVIYPEIPRHCLPLLFQVFTALGLAG